MVSIQIYQDLCVEKKKKATKPPQQKTTFPLTNIFIKFYLKKQLKELLTVSCIFFLCSHVWLFHRFLMTQSTQSTHSAAWIVCYSPMLEAGAECQYGISISHYNLWVLFGTAWLRIWHSRLFLCGSADPSTEDAMDAGEICLCSLTRSPSMVVCPDLEPQCMGCFSKVQEHDLPASTFMVKKKRPLIDFKVRGLV